MASLPEEAQVEIEIYETLVAQFGIVDDTTVRLEIVWPRPEELSELLAPLGRVPFLREGKLTYLEAADGRLFIIPEGLEEELRVVPLSAAERRAYPNCGSEYELAQEDPEEYLIPMLGALPAAQEYAERLLRTHRPDFDAHPVAVRANWLIETIKRVNAVGDAMDALAIYLLYTIPGKKRATSALRNPKRDVWAAIYRDVYEASDEQIRSILELPPLSPVRRDPNRLSPAERADLKKDDPTVRSAVKRGREILERAYGVEGWREKAARMNATWEALHGPE